MIRLPAADIQIGDHVTRKFFGLTFNVDTIWSTLIAAAIVLVLGLWVRRRLTHGVPGKLQLFFETVAAAVQKQVHDSIGVDVVPAAVPLAMALFLFILVANWIGQLPFGDTPNYIPPPTADTNLTYALAFTVVFWVHAAAIRRRGFFPYVKSFFKPLWLSPIKIIEEIAKPITLALRLFGNIFSGGIMLALIGIMPVFILWAPNLIWKVFDSAIGVIQAFIFALLTILYFSFAVSEQGH
ncbi:MAG TPA: F0F1 ATP synthase subunit A [Mycobacteriales bacterium]|nr:F0F1 ATP synthase subunit A [Mycobacteriales bacterium]